jgi:hypothetical protein
VAAAGATLTLSGTDIALTASMRVFDHVGLLGLVVAAWAFASLVGGFFYGTMPRRRDPLLLLVLLPALTMLMALAGSWWALLLLRPALGPFLRPPGLVDRGHNRRFRPARPARARRPRAQAKTASDVPARSPKSGSGLGKRQP